jgi:hypothetical protein
MNLETVDLKEAIVATNSRITIGVCAMDKKARSKPMLELLSMYIAPPPPSMCIKL